VVERILCIRADASDAIGMGHVERCLALAAALVPYSFRPILVTAHPSGLGSRLANVKGEVVALKGHTRQGGLAAREDFTAFVEVATQLGAHVVLLDVDSYGDDIDPLVLEARGKLLVVAMGRRTKRRYVADIVINANLLAFDLGYRSHDGTTEFLLGPSYAMIRPTLVEQRGPEASETVPAHVDRILIALGGADPLGLSPRVAALVARALPDAEIDLVLGPCTRMQLREEAELLPAHNPKITVSVDPSDLDVRIAAAHLGLVGAGTMILELLAVGVPVMALAQNADQVAYLPPLVDRRIVVAIDVSNGVPEALLVQGVRALSALPAMRLDLARGGYGLIDGRGGERIATAILRRLRAQANHI